MDVPSELLALSNMPVIDEKFQGNIKTVYFEETPVISTYLVAVVVGLFDHLEATTTDGTHAKKSSFLTTNCFFHMFKFLTCCTGVKVRAYCPIGRSDEAKLVLDLAVKSLQFFTK